MVIKTIIYGVNIFSQANSHINDRMLLGTLLNRVTNERLHCFKFINIVVIYFLIIQFVNKLHNPDGPLPIHFSRRILPPQILIMCINWSYHDISDVLNLRKVVDISWVILHIFHIVWINNFIIINYFTRYSLIWWISYLPCLPEAFDNGIDVLLFLVY